MMKNINIYNKLLIFFNVLLLFSIIIDPTGVISRYKLFFLPIIFLLIPILNYNMIKRICLLLAIFFISYAYSMLSNNVIDFNSAIKILLAIIGLLYIGAININILKSYKIFYVLTILMSIVVIVLYCLAYTSHSFYVALAQFSKTHNDCFWVVPGRSFIGIKINAVFWPSAILCLLSLAISGYFFFTTKKGRYFLIIILLFLCLFFSGTRANILSSIMLIIGIYVFYLFKNKKVNQIGMILSIAFFFFTLIIYLLLNDKGEVSLQTKSLHVLSYNELFSEKPFNFLMFGNGPRFLFYTKGSQSFKSLTELSYLDLIKDFGLIQTCIIIGVFLFPLIKLYNNNYYDLFFKRAIILSYLAYLFIAGTNPYLFSLPGMYFYIFISGISMSKNFFNQFSHTRKKSNILYFLIKY